MYDFFFSSGAMFSQLRSNIKTNEFNAGKYYKIAQAYEFCFKMPYENAKCQCSKTCNHKLPSYALQHHAPICYNKRINVAKNLGIQLNILSKCTTDLPKVAKISMNHILANGNQLCDILKLKDEDFYKETSKDISNCPKDYFSLIYSDLQSKITQVVTSKNGKSQKSQQLIQFYQQMKQLLIIYKRDFNPLLQFFTVICSLSAPTMLHLVLSCAVPIAAFLGAITGVLVALAYGHHRANVPLQRADQALEDALAQQKQGGRLLNNLVTQAMNRVTREERRRWHRKLGQKMGAGGGIVVGTASGCMVGTTVAASTGAIIGGPVGFVVGGVVGVLVGDIAGGLRSSYN